MHWSDLAGTRCIGFEPKPLNDLESIEVILSSTFKKESLKAYVGEQSDVPSP